MSNIGIKDRIASFTVISIAVYIAIWLLPAIIVHPIDFVVELITGFEYSDGWTYGIMVWTFIVIAYPIVYLVTLIFLIYKEKTNTKNA